MMPSLLDRDLILDILFEPPVGGLFMFHFWLPDRYKLQGYTSINDTSMSYICIVM